MMAESRLVSGIVNRDEEHIMLIYGDPNEVDPEDFIPVALVAPLPGEGFVVQHTLSGDDPQAEKMVRQAQHELRYYLAELGEPDPWAYAIYHCGSVVNWYSRVRWVYNLAVEGHDNGSGCEATGHQEV